MTELPGWTELATTLAMMLAGYGLKLLREYLSKKGDEAAAKTGFTFLAKLDDVAMGVVMDLHNNLAREWKEASADGILTKEEKAKLRSTAINVIVEHFGMNKLMSVFSNDEAAITRLVSNKVEKAVSLSSELRNP